MKRHLNRILAGLMIGVSIINLVGCSSPSLKGEETGVTTATNQKVPMGRYMEEMIELPTDFKFITYYTTDQNHNLTLYGYNNDDKLIAYILQEGEEWQTKDVAWLRQLEADKNNIIDIVIGEDNRTYVLYTNENMVYKLNRVAEDGTLEERPFEYTAEDGMPSKIRVLANGDVLVHKYYTGVTKYSGVDGTRQTEYEGTEGEFAVVGDQLALVDSQRGGVVFYNLVTGKEEKMISHEEMINKLFSDQEGNLYVVSSSGVNRLAGGGSTWENIIEAGMSSLGKPSSYILDMSADGEGFNAVFRDQQDGYEMIRYTYNPDVPSRPTIEMSVYMLEDNMTIRQAAAEYQSQNPDVMIRLQVGIKQGEATTKADAIRTLNTELLAGKGPDILILDNLPMDSYIDKGVLFDMNAFVEPMVEGGQLLENIIKPYKKENKLYAVPTSFELPMIWGDQELLEAGGSLEDLAEWERTHPNKQVLYSSTPQILIEQFYGASTANWLDDKGQIKEQEFIRFLESIKILSDENAKEILNENDFYEARHFSREYMAYGDTQVHVEALKGFLYMTTPYSFMNHRDNGDFKVLESDGKGVYEASGIIGINANSKNIELAKGIVETALSANVQNVDLGEGLPVNTEAFNQQSDPDAISKSMMAVQMSTAGGRPIEFVEATPEAYKKVAEAGKIVSQPVYKDEVLLQMIIEETKGYFDGTKTAEEAAKAVAQRTKAYLSE